MDGDLGPVIFVVFMVVLVGTVVLACIADGNEYPAEECGDEEDV